MVEQEKLREMEESAEELYQDYSNIVGCSANVTATLQGNRIINVKRKVRDIHNNTSKTFACPYIHSEADIKPLLAPVEVSKRVVDSTSATGLVNIKICEAGDAKERKCVIEITRDISVERIVDVSSVHGKVIADTWFGTSGCNHFSNDEKYFVYVAVPKDTKTTSYFDIATESSVDAKASDDSFFPNKYDYKEDWGEKYTGVAELGLYVLNIENGKVIRIPNIPKNVTVGQPIFTPCGRGVVYTAWNNEPKRLGMIYCFQRPCSIRFVSIIKLLDNLELSSSNNVGSAVESGDIVSSHCIPPEVLSCSHINLTPHIQLARYPQFNNCLANDNDNENSYLVFLGHRNGFDTHNASSGLYSLDWTNLLLSMGSTLWEPHDSKNPIEVNTESLMETVIEEASPAVANSNNVLVNCFLFPGLFAMSILPCSFITPKLLLLETNWRAVSVILVVNIETFDLRVISMKDGHFHLSNIFPSGNSRIGDRQMSADYATPVGVGAHSAETSWQDSAPFSLNLLCTAGGLEGGVVLLASNTSTRPRLGYVAAAELIPLLAHSRMNGLISMIPFSGQGKKLKSIFSDVFPLMSLSASSPNGSNPENISITEDALDEMESYVLQTRLSDNSSILIESVLLFPSKDFPGEGIPLLVVPHGGPHSQFTTSFMAPYAYLALTLNMAVLMVNYRGSTGYGQAELDSLPGQIGSQDVKDVHAAILAALEVNDIRLDSQRICVAGGSHGGFLTAHLLGQYPGLFRAGACRNPVINVPSMAMVSDITDWCIVEACGIGGPKASNPNVLYDFESYDSPNLAQLEMMYNCSPIRHVKNVTAPVLMLLGAKDRRVPFSQGLEYYHNLCRVPDRVNVPTDIRLYPDADHAIDIPDSEADQFISMKKWFEKYV